MASPMVEAAESAGEIPASLVKELGMYQRIKWTSEDNTIIDNINVVIVRNISNDFDKYNSDLPDI
jgi:hypothetical protein